MRTSLGGPNPQKGSQGTQGRSSISNSSGLMMAPGGKQSKQQKDWYKQNSMQSPTPWAPNPQAQPQAQQTPAYTAESTIEAPRYIQDSTTQDAVNNTLAQGRANSDKRFQVKQLDRAGLSRGAGQNFMAAQEGVQQMQKAASAASEVEASDQRVNDQMRSDYERAREMETQNNAMIQHNLSQSDWARVFAQKSLNAQLQMAQMQAQLQLRLALMR